MNRSIPFNSYRAALFDHPWEFDTHSEAGQEKSASQHYDTMTLPEILALRDELKLEWIFAPDCIAIFWGTWPILARGDLHTVVRHYGFTPIGGGSWFKITSRNKDTFGNGYIFRDSCEPYIVATRGEPGRPPIGHRHWRNGFRRLRREHSRKPDYLHRALEDMYPIGPRIEFFARERRKGWDAWGREVGLFDGEPVAPRERTPKRPVIPEPGPLLHAMGAI